MKVLIMEDEIQIREGIRAEVAWSRLGIQEIYTAENGSDGLKKAQILRPDIILADIRMPKMDGISAVKKLREFLPDCSIIFVSAYPEKDYFKEAIRLKAVSFVEKPVDIDELTRVLKEAVEEQTQNARQKEKNEQADLFSAQRFVKKLCRNEFADAKECRSALKEMGIECSDFEFFRCLILRAANGLVKEEENDWISFCSEVQEHLREAPVKMLCDVRESNCMVFFLFLKREAEAQPAERWLQGRLAGLKRWWIAEGTAERNVSRLYSSYEEAVIQENGTFYLPFGSVIGKSESDISVFFDFSSWRADFAQELSRGNWEGVRSLTDSFAGQLLERKNLHHKPVRNFYISLFRELQEYCEKNSILIRNVSGNSFPDLANQADCFAELKEAFQKELEKVREAGGKSEESGEKEDILRVKKYVLDHYGNSMLSIKEVADAAGRSVSYLCTMFKTETGVTLNQYITDVRMEAARAMLENPKNNVKDVSGSVGYPDGSYFARVFRKCTGQTPTEYRDERMKLR